MAPLYDVIVAGLGAMGSAIAAHLARRGARVLGLDRFHPPHEMGSSHGESRIIREAYYEHPAYVPLVQRAHALWSELEAESGRTLLRTTGALMLGAPRSRVVAGALESAAAHDLAHERLDAAELRRRFPAFTPADGDVAVYEPRAGVLFPEECIRAQLDAAAAHGATLVYGEPLLDWREVDGGGIEVRTPTSRYHAGQLVLGVGPWLPDLVSALPLEVERQVVCWFRPHDSAATLQPEVMPVYLWEIEDGRAFYGMPELGRGIKAAQHHGREHASSADAVRRTIDAADVEPVRGFLEHHLPSAAGALLRTSVCLYTNTPDRHFLLDRHPHSERVHVVSACSGHGFKFASAIGERVAAELLDGAPALQPELFGAARFSA